MKDWIKINDNYCDVLGVGNASKKEETVDVSGVDTSEISSVPMKVEDKETQTELRHRPIPLTITKEATTQTLDVRPVKKKYDCFLCF